MKHEIYCVRIIMMPSNRLAVVLQRILLLLHLVKLFIVVVDDALVCLNLVCDSLQADD